MKSTIKTLEQLQQMRARSVSSLVGKLAQQQQLCQRYENNIQALTDLKESSRQFTAPSPVQLHNHASYNRVIQKVIDWQKQEQALANQQAQSLQRNLLQEARKEKTVEQVLTDHKVQLAREQARKEQKLTDACRPQRQQHNRAPVKGQR
ncbi:MAG: flagellar export protein FliJ [Enterobacteriaceae bacterium]